MAAGCKLDGAHINLPRLQIGFHEEESSKSRQMKNRPKRPTTGSLSLKSVISLVYYAEIML